MLPQPGDTIAGKYRIEARLGRGGMGAVYRATHLLTEKAVALKWMLPPSSNARSTSRFIREARTASRIDHPNVVNVYDVGQDNSGWYLVMDLLHGEPLSARIKRAPLTTQETADILVSAMHGVAAVHQAGVIHRDLKPDNIFLCQAADARAPSVQAKVLDFGISALDSSERNETTLTEEGTLLGTPAYMSPEQVRSPRNLDVRADVYSLGVILYEMLTGRRPFETDSYSGLVLAIVHDKPTAPRVHRQDVPLALEAVVLRALSKIKEERQPNIASLIADVSPFTSHPEAAADVVFRPEARALKPWHVLLAASLLALAGAWGFWRGVRNSDPAPRPGTTTQPIPAKEKEVVHANVEAPTAPLNDADIAQPLASVPIVEPAIIAPSPTPKTKDALERKTTRPAAAASQPDKRPLPTTKPAKPMCDPPYIIDASGRTIFKLECM